MAMSRSSARRAPRLATVLVAAIAGAAALQVARNAFLPSPAVQRSLPSALRGAGAAAAILASGAAPALAEEELGFLNFGKVELGGGFALNLDIPETGIVNIAVLIGGLLYLLGPLLTQSMASREKEIQTDIDDAIAKYSEAGLRLAEAEKSQAQAAQVVAEINGCIAKDQHELEESIASSSKIAIARQEEGATKTMASLKGSADSRVERYITTEAMNRGLAVLSKPVKTTQDKFMAAAIAGL